MIRIFLFLPLLTLGLCLGSCDGLMQKNDEFSASQEEHLSMIQSEMRAIVATGDTIDILMQKLESMDSSRFTDETNQDIASITSALLVLERQQENLENAYSTLVSNYRNTIEQYKNSELEQEAVEEALEQMANKPANLMQNHENLLHKLMRVREQIQELDKLKEEGSRQRV